VVLELGAVVLEAAAWPSRRVRHLELGAVVFEAEVSSSRRVCRLDRTGVDSIGPSSAQLGQHRHVASMSMASTSRRVRHLEAGAVVSRSAPSFLRQCRCV
jgi:hypothetical protein